MPAIIYQIIICLVAASILGFIIGWIFSSFVRNEKHENQILAVRDRFDEQKEQINQIASDVEAKERELSIVKQEYGTVQKEMLSLNMDYDDSGLELSKIADLEYDNNILTEQIKEQKICEDENETLKIELEEREETNTKLNDKIEELKEVEVSYKENILKIAELESIQNSGNTEKLKIKNSELLKKIEKHNLIETVNNNEIQRLTLSHENMKEKIKKLKLIKIESENKNRLINKLEDDKKRLKANISNNNKINTAICKDEQIIKEGDLTLVGLQEDQISKIIKDLFA